MQWFDNLSIKMKMLAVFSVMLLIVLGLSLFAGMQMSAINNASTEISNNWFPSARLVSNMHQNISDLYSAELQYRQSTTLAHSQALKAELAATRSVLLENEKKYVPLIASEQERALYYTYFQWRTQYLSLIFPGADAAAHGVPAERNGALFATYKQVKGALDALININVAGADLANSSADAVYTQSLHWLFNAVVTSLALAMFLTAILHYRIGKPIRQLAKVADKIEQGELTTRSQLRYTKGELGELARSFDQMAATLQYRQQEIKQANLQLSQKFDQLQAIYRVTAMVNQHGPVMDTYAEVIEVLHDTAHADRASILLLDEQGIMRFIAWRGLSEAHRKRVEEYNPWAIDNVDMQPIVVVDVAQTPSLGAMQEALVAEGVRAVAYIPLLYQKRLLGQFVLYRNQAHVFLREEIQLAETLASQIAFAIERARQTTQLERHALYDHLTNIPNRSLLHDRLRQAIIASHRTGVALTLLLIDLDRFKEINDTLGHDKGDLVLKQIGPRIQSVLRQLDTVARLGGDEFAVLLPTIGTIIQAEYTASKILYALQEPFMLGELSMEIGASIGIALYPDHGGESDELVRCADVAMYVAKQQRSGYAVYAQQLDHHSLRKLTLISELRQAIEHNQLVLHYQPKLNLKDQTFIGVEALVRWVHPQHGLIYPDQFIPAAEQSGLEKPLRLWVIAQALQQHIAWKRMGHVIPVAVNLSARSLHDLALPQMLEQLLHQHQVSPDMFTLEITESAIMIDPARALNVLTKINALGIQFAIDDFGTGYSSLAYLQRLPADTVKIDKSFVIEMNKDVNNNTIVRSTIDMAHNLGLSVTAEGVETQQTWLALSLLGCDVAQGYYISYPLPADEFIAWLQNAQWDMG